MKFRLLSLFLILALALTACGEQEPAHREIDLEAAYQAVMTLQEETEAEALVMFPESNPEVIDSFYPGLSAIELEQQVYYLAPVFGFACEIMLLEAKDEEGARTAAEICRARIEKGSSDTAYPDTAALWEKNGQVHTEGRYVCMIVLPDGYVIPENVFALEG